MGTTGIFYFYEFVMHTAAPGGAPPRRFNDGSFLDTGK
jgi:hypothetical protein